MRRLITTMLAVTAVAGVGGTAASAAARPHTAARPQIVDQVGDANAVNGQGLGPRVPTVMTPQDVAAADINSVSFATRSAIVAGKRVHDALVVTMTLAGATQRPIGYSVTARIPGSCNLLLLHYQDFVTFQSAFASCGNAGATGPTQDLPTAVDVNNVAHTITWTIDAGLRRNATLTQLQAKTSAFVLGVLDYAASSGAYRLGH